MLTLTSTVRNGDQELDRSERKTTTMQALEFVVTYPWAHVARTASTCLVLEEIGPNTGRIFSWQYDGPAGEILPLLKFSYLQIALEAACFCVMSPEWQSKVIADTVKSLSGFPIEARTPLSAVCACVREQEFAELARELAASIPLSETPLVLERNLIPGWKWTFAACSRAIALLQSMGITAEEDILAGIRCYTAVGLGNLFAAVQLHREGACSFQEALTLA